MKKEFEDVTEIDFKNIFKHWFQLVAYKDPQHYQDLDWDWEEEIEKFIKNPCKEYNYQLTVKQEDDEYLMQEENEK